MIGKNLSMDEKTAQVQEAHIRLGRKKQSWPVFVFPEFRGSITVSDVLAAPPGPDRDDMIHRWSISVWDVYRESADHH
jgi:hypothetical protein